MDINEVIDKVGHYGWGQTKMFMPIFVVTQVLASGMLYQPAFSLYNPGNGTEPANISVQSEKEFHTFKDTNPECTVQLTDTIQSVLYGNIVGNLLLFIPDTIGRKPAALIFCLCMVAGSSIPLYLPSCHSMSIAFLIIGVAVQALYVSVTSYTYEGFGPKGWIYIAGLAGVLWPLGQVYVTVAAYLTRDWITTTYIVMASYATAAVAIYISPESPRWLYTKHRVQETLEIYQKVARLNGITERLEKVELQKCQQTDSQWYDMFKSWTMIKRLLLFGYCCVAVNYAYFTTTMVAVIDEDSNAGFVGLCKRMLISGLMEMCTPLVAFTTLKLFSPKHACLVTAAMYSATLAPILLLSKAEYGTAIFVLACLGKVLGNALWYGLDPLTNRLIPTSMRASAVGCIRILGNMGSVAGSFAVDFTNLLVPQGLHNRSYWVALPVVMLTLVCIALLPNCNDGIALDTLEDLEAEASLLRKKLHHGKAALHSRDC